MANYNNLDSGYIPSVNFRSDVESEVIKPYVRERLNSFFKVKEGVDEIENLHKIKPEDAITDIDFAQCNDDGERTVPFEYIYDVVMTGAEKVNGRIDYIAYTLTYDPELTPYQCEETGMNYGCLTLAGEPVLYYVRLDLQDLISEVRKNTFLP